MQCDRSIFSARLSPEHRTQHEGGTNTERCVFGKAWSTSTEHRVFRKTRSKRESLPKNVMFDVNPSIDGAKTAVLFWGGGTNYLELGVFCPRNGSAVFSLEGGHKHPLFTPCRDNEGSKSIDRTAHPCEVNAIIPFRTAVPFWGQTTWNLSGLSPKRDCSSKWVN